MIMPPPGYDFSLADSLPDGTSTHGHDPLVCPEMKAVFYASGLAFIDKMNINSFENIHIYPMIAEILELEYDPNSIDGDSEFLGKILK